MPLKTDQSNESKRTVHMNAVIDFEWQNVSPNDINHTKALLEEYFIYMVICYHKWCAVTRLAK